MNENNPDLNRTKSKLKEEVNLFERNLKKATSAEEQKDLYSDLINTCTQTLNSEVETLNQVIQEKNVLASATASKFLY